MIHVRVLNDINFIYNFVYYPSQQFDFTGRRRHRQMGISGDWTNHMIARVCAAGQRQNVIRTHIRTPSLGYHVRLPVKAVNVRVRAGDVRE